MSKPKPAPAPELNWPAAVVEMVPIAELVPYARNAKRHPPAQIKALRGLMREFGWTMPILRDEAGSIIAGHGRLEAGAEEGYALAPCVTARGWSEAKKRAYRIADNKLAEMSTWDDELLLAELQELRAEGVDLETLTGFDDAAFDALMDATDGAGGDYTHKLAAPIYEPSGPCPKIKDLCDRAKVNELLAEIDAAGLPREITAFLKFAAERHATFDFAAIANFYAHADENVQHLFQRSALVIVDFDKAIENGFARVTDALEAQLAKDHPDE